MTQADILTYLENNEGWFTPEEIQKHARCRISNVHRALKKLRMHGLIRARKHNKDHIKSYGKQEYSTKW